MITSPKGLVHIALVRSLDRSCSNIRPTGWLRRNPQFPAFGRNVVAGQKSEGHDPDEADHSSEQHTCDQFLCHNVATLS